MKTLIINGSPRKKGETAFLIDEFKRQISGDSVEIPAYRSKISPCIDCRHCQKEKGCSIKDDMELIYNDDYDNIVIASPVYMSTLTPPVMSICSRLQIYYSAKRILKDEIKLKEKNAVLILTAGGDGSPSQALEAAKLFFRIIKARCDENNVILSLNTDKLPSKDDINAINRIKETARRLNESLG